MGRLGGTFHVREKALGVGLNTDDTGGRRCGSLLVGKDD